MHYRAKQSIAFLAYAGFLVSLAPCVDNSPKSEPTVGVDKPEVLEVEHVVTQDGLECVRYKHGGNFGLSCNWPEYNWKRNNGKI